MKKDIISKINEITGNKINEMSDDENPHFVFQSVNTKLLLAMATGKVNAQEYAKLEMVNRGFDKKGSWIGFKASKELWKPKVK